MPEAESGHSLLVLGVHLKAHSYPSVLHRVEGFKQSGRFRVQEINHPMGSRHLWRAAQGGLLAGCRALPAHLTVLARYLAARERQRAYVPYPAVGVGALLSMLPKALRPRSTVLDAFISLYDAAVNDRQLLDPHSLTARLLWRIERRAFKAADWVIVDTPQNAEHLAREFSLSLDKFVAVPLAIDEAAFIPAPYRPVQGRCRVLFFGTFIPLHGAEVIAQAASTLEHRKDIQFKLIGDGQTAGTVRRILASRPSNVEWEQTWLDPEGLAKEIGASDICLGIFGTSVKAQRVCPLKLYACCAVGRPVITGDTLWARQALAEFREPAFARVPVGEPLALAAEIEALADQPDRRRELARAARRFYEAKLSNAIGLEKLAALLDRD